MPTAPDPPEAHRPVQQEGHSVLASGVGTVSTFLAEPGPVATRQIRGRPVADAG
jgi:hypothetical protein